MAFPRHFIRSLAPPQQKRFILNAGCAIPAETPPANIKAMLAAAVIPPRF